MQITVTFQMKDQSADVMLDSGQTIAEVVGTLQKARKLPMASADFYRLYCGTRIVSAYSSFDEQGIYSGERLQAILSDGEKA